MNKALGVFELMQEYIKNKDATKAIRNGRAIYMVTYKCAADNCVMDGTAEEDFCNVCRVRHQYFKQLRTLQYRNVAILRRVRSFVTRK